LILHSLAAAARILQISWANDPVLFSTAWPVKKKYKIENKSVTELCNGMLWSAKEREKLFVNIIIFLIGHVGCHAFMLYFRDLPKYLFSPLCQQHVPCYVSYIYYTTD
jgi:hypothetical protein